MNGTAPVSTAGAPAVAATPAARKKLTGYVGFANLPNQFHRKSVRKGFSFTTMVVGESGLGKSTLINTLFNTTLYPRKEVPPPHHERPKTVAIESISSGKLQHMESLILVSHAHIMPFSALALFRHRRERRPFATERC
jgi:septin 7